MPLLRFRQDFLQHQFTARQAWLPITILGVAELRETRRAFILQHSALILDLRYDLLDSQTAFLQQRLDRSARYHADVPRSHLRHPEKDVRESLLRFRDRSIIDGYSENINKKWGWFSSEVNLLCAHPRYVINRYRCSCHARKSEYRNLKLRTGEIIRNRLVKYYEPLHTEQIILSMMYPGSFRMKRNMLPSITNMSVSL